MTPGSANPYSQAVAMFLDKKIGYFDIYTTIENAMESHKNELILDPSLDDIVACDLWVGLSLTPRCQIGYVDVCCHECVLFGFMFKGEAKLREHLSDGVPAVINWCFDCKIT
jgi:hypothetical protein